MSNGWLLDQSADAEAAIFSKYRTKRNYFKAQVRRLLLLVSLLFAFSTDKG